MNAARAGTVTIANAVGNGVADDKLTYTYVPALIEYYLGERPLLPNVPTFRLDDADVREHCLARADQLVFKPVDGSGGHGIVIGPQATDSELAEVTAKVRDLPRAWIAQEVVMLSTVPSQDGDLLVPRHVDLRPFATNDGERVHVLPGGLTRVALRRGQPGGQLQRRAAAPRTPGCSPPGRPGRPVWTVRWTWSRPRCRRTRPTPARPPSRPSSSSRAAGAGARC